MKTLILSLTLILASASFVFAGNYDNPFDNNKRPYEDNWGNNYKSRDNLYKDTDRDGVINKYDYNDRNPNIQNPYQRDYNQGYGSRKNRSRW